MLIDHETISPPWMDTPTQGENTYQANDLSFAFFDQKLETPLTRLADSLSKEVKISPTTFDHEIAIEIRMEGVPPTVFYFGVGVTPDPLELSQAIQLINALCDHGRKPRASEYSDVLVNSKTVIRDSETLVSLIASSAGLRSWSTGASRLIASSKEVA